VTTYQHLPAIIPAEHHDDLPMFGEAIEAVRAGDVDRIIHWPDGGEPFARAFKIIQIFDLHAFVTPQPEQEQAS
jgi:hypothetical protein